MSQTTPRPPAGETDAQRVAREKAIYQQQRVANRRKRQRAGGRDMVLSMAVMLIPVLLIVWFFQRTPARPPAPSVDVVGAVSAARQQAKFPIYAPTNLPKGWVPVRADFVPAGGNLLGHGGMAHPTWVLGYQGPDEKYYEVDEQAPAAPSFVGDFAHNAAPSGTPITTSGRRFQPLTSDDAAMHYLVASDSALTVLVSSAASPEAVQAFAGALSASGAPAH